MSETSISVAPATNLKKPKAKAKKKAAFEKAKPFNAKRMMKAILDRRYELGQSLSEAAAAAKLSKTGLQGVEAKGTCNLDALVKICNWLELPITHFFS